MPEQNRVKYSSSTQPWLHELNGSSALERWLHDSPQPDPWNGLSREPLFALPLRGVAMNNSCDKETIKPDELRVLARKVYAALGAE
jgi:hypothetical protein